jgi:hypothetical protein
MPEPAAVAARRFDSVAPGCGGASHRRRPPWTPQHRRGDRAWVPDHVDDLCAGEDPFHRCQRERVLRCLLAPPGLALHRGPRSKDVAHHPAERAVVLEGADIQLQSPASHAAGDHQVGRQAPSRCGVAGIAMHREEPWQRPRLVRKRDAAVGAKQVAYQRGPAARTPHDEDGRRIVQAVNASARVRRGGCRRRGARARGEPPRRSRRTGCCPGPCRR